MGNPGSCYRLLLLSSIAKCSAFKLKRYNMTSLCMLALIRRNRNRYVLVQ
ncbi:hypothetical protein SAMN05444008_101133 [Cnuella takakiae]|uniref:Uncharacterized protein n=1 Tax=Cnuella takakiae TaxID=1302690 RepID=A0A1M4SI53_9BACT|nr:hypothetical protein SAMN05444008_101133 [Cnuella takakiae]